MPSNKALQTDKDKLSRLLHSQEPRQLAFAAELGRYTSQEVTGMAGKKTGSFNTKGIEGLAKDKPVVYKIENAQGKNLYTGIAKRGRVEQRLKEHLPGGPDPVRGGTKVHIQQKPSIEQAAKSEARIIKQEQPPQNKKGK